MYKSISNLMPSAVRAGAVGASLIFSCAANALAHPIQEPARPTDAQFQARNLVEQGVQAFRNGQYDEATQDFLRAKELDPRLMNARLYLATAYEAQYTPGALGEESFHRGKAAVEE